MSKNNESAKTCAANMSEGNSNTINVNGKTYENRTANLESWYNFTTEQKNTISEKYGNPIYLVRQIFDANGQKMTKGQKTLCVFDLGAIVDKTTLNKLCGVEIAERATNGENHSTKTTAAEKAAAAVQKVAAAVAELSLSDDNKIAAAEHFAAVVEMLNAAAETERQNAAAAAKRAAAIAALVAVGFDETTAAATVDRQGK